MAPAPRSPAQRAPVPPSFGGRRINDARLRNRQQLGRLRDCVLSSHGGRGQHVDLRSFAKPVLVQRLRGRPGEQSHDNALLRRASGISSYDAQYWKPVIGSSVGQGLGLTVSSSQPVGSTDLGPLTFVGVNPSDAHTRVGESTWYRMRFKIPSSAFIGAAGDFQWIWEWHEQSPCDGNSIAFGFSNWGLLQPESDPALLPTRRRERNAPTYENWYSASGQGVPLALQKDRWYSLVANIVWDTKAKGTGGTGEISIWLDGQGRSPPPDDQLEQRRRPCLDERASVPDALHGRVQRGAGSPFAWALQLSDASRNRADERVDFDDFYIGPSAASVGFTP